MFSDRALFYQMGATDQFYLNISLKIAKVLETPVGRIQVWFSLSAYHFPVFDIPFSNFVHFLKN
jgi:hypothetical protein